MGSLVQPLGAALLTLAFVLPAAEAQPQTAKQRTLHAGDAHGRRVEKLKEGRQITVRRGTPSWLTLGNGARVGSGDSYVTSTFDQPSPVEGTFSGYRGRERLTNQYGVPGAALFQF